MRLRSAILSVLTLAGLLATTTTGSAAPPSAPGGSGPYSAGYGTTLRLTNHTIYRPDTLPAGVKLPIVAWGNGACRADGTWFEDILTEWASHGFLVIANGRPGGSGSTDSEMLTDSIDWAIAENSRRASKYYGRLDTTKIAVMGQSCGGIETYEVAADPRLTTTVLWNSGLLSDSQNHLLQFGRVGGHWLKWQLKGDAASRAQFVGSDCGLCSTDWDVLRKDLG